MNLTLVQIIAGISLAITVGFFLILAALNKESENVELRKKRLRELENFKQELAEDLKCLANLTSREKEIVEETRREEREKSKRIQKQ